MGLDNRSEEDGILEPSTATVGKAKEGSLRVQNVLYCYERALEYLSLASLLPQGSTDHPSSAPGPSLQGRHLERLDLSRNGMARPVPAVRGHGMIWMAALIAEYLSAPGPDRPAQLFSGPICIVSRWTSGEKKGL